MIIGVIVVLAVGGLLGYKHLGKSRLDNAEKALLAPSPEDQIKALVQREVDAWNRSDFSYNPEDDCKANAGNDPHVNENRALRAQTGTMSASVADIHVTGDQATADVTVKFQKLPDKPLAHSLQLVKEDGGWKDCTPPD